MFDMIVILGVSLDVHLPGVPISVFWDTLRTPMSPYSELCVAEPLGNLILSQGLKCGLKRPRGDAPFTARGRQKLPCAQGGNRQSALLDQCTSRNFHCIHRVFRVVAQLYAADRDLLTGNWQSTMHSFCASCWRAVFIASEGLPRGCPARTG